MLRYDEMTPDERGWMCNGCGPKLSVSIDIVPDFIFHEACEVHDFDYWLGHSKLDRYRADVRFRSRMLALARAQKTWWSRRWYTFLAWRYYATVRLFGARLFSFRAGYATRADLIEEMSLG